MGGSLTDPTSLYRFFDATGNLLYVGITRQQKGRFNQHAATKEWWSEVASSTVEHFPTREDALRAEAEAIGTENPRYNIALGFAPRDPWVGYRFVRYMGGPAHGYVEWDFCEEGDVREPSLIRKTYHHEGGKDYETLDDFKVATYRLFETKRRVVTYVFHAWGLPEVETIDG